MGTTVFAAGAAGRAAEETKCKELNLPLDAEVEKLMVDKKYRFRQLY